MVKAFIRCIWLAINDLYGWIGVLFTVLTPIAGVIAMPWWYWFPAIAACAFLIRMVLLQWELIRSRDIADDWTLEKLIVYIRDRSDFRCRHTNEVHWWKWIEQEILDNLSAGRLRSWGRPTLDTGERRAGLMATKQEIPKEHWLTLRLPDYVMVLSGDAKETIASSDLISKGGRRFHDITINMDQAMLIWPKLPWWRKWATKPLVLH
jgi:hypothetical protein